MTADRQGGHPMTTDTFTTAARVRANGRWPMQEERHAFVAGAVWARTHLATQEPAAAEVRKAQAGAWEKGKGDGLRQADYEYGARDFYVAINPYREQED